MVREKKIERKSLQDKKGKTLRFAGNIGSTVLNFKQLKYQTTSSNTGK